MDGRGKGNFSKSDSATWRKKEAREQKHNFNSHPHVFNHSDLSKGKKSITKKYCLLHQKSAEQNVKKEGNWSIPNRQGAYPDYTPERANK